MKCASAPGVRNVLKLTSVVDFRSAIEAIAALSQLTDREFHSVAICEMEIFVADARRDLQKRGRDLQNLKHFWGEFNDFSEFSRRILAPTLRFAARLIIKQINNFLITNFWQLVCIIDRLIEWLYRGKATEWAHCIQPTVRPWNVRRERQVVNSEPIPQSLCCSERYCGSQICVLIEIGDYSQVLFIFGHLVRLLRRPRCCCAAVLLLQFSLTSYRFQERQEPRTSRLSYATVTMNDLCTRISFKGRLPTSGRWAVRRVMYCR